MLIRGIIAIRGALGFMARVGVLGIDILEGG
jgi:hypothetical protein